MYSVPFVLRELQQGDWQIIREDKQGSLKITPENLEENLDPTFTSLGHTLILLPKIQ